MGTMSVNEIVGGLQPADPGNSIGRGVKRAWSYLKLLRAESTDIPTLFWNNRVCASDRARAKALRQQYESVFTREDLCSTPSLGLLPYPDIPELFVSELGVMKLLQNTDTSKAAGPDLLQARILKEAAVELTPILTALFRQSYDSGLLPADWKKVNVSAIYKRGPKSDPKNYRPVSLTALTCKIMEHIVCSHLPRHLSANSIITPIQHGFRRSLSCDTQLISVIHEWAKVLNIRGQVDVIFLDFAKAFDSVPHARLLLKARHYGIRGKLNE